MAATDFSRWDAVVLACGLIGGTVFLTTTPDFLAHRAGVIEVVLTGWVFGIVSVGPLVFVSQFIRGREVTLRFGEWLWVIPPIAFLSALMLCSIPGGVSSGWNLLVFAVWVHFQGVISLISIPLVFGRNRSWTERLGSIACLLVGIALVSHLMLHPLEI